MRSIHVSYYVSGYFHSPPWCLFLFFHAISIRTGRRCAAGGGSAVGSAPTLPVPHGVATRAPYRPSLLRGPHSAEGVPGGPPRHYEGAKKLAYRVVSQVFKSFFVVSTYRVRSHAAARGRTQLQPTQPAARRRVTPRSGRDRRGSLRATRRPIHRRYNILRTCCLFHVTLNIFYSGRCRTPRLPACRGLPPHTAAPGLQRGLLEASIPHGFRFYSCRVRFTVTPR